MKNKILAVQMVVLVFSYSSHAQPKPASPLKGKYFGQKPPGMTATLFAQGIISTDSIEHSAPAFSPDGKTVLWTRIYPGKPAFLVEMKMVNGRWTKPQPPSFANKDADDFYPDFSVDGKELFFSSRRSLPSGYPKKEDMWIWKVEKKSSGWGLATPLDSTIIKGFEYAHSVSKKGTLFFSSRRKGARDFDIFCSQYVNGTYQPPRLLDTNINKAGYEDGPFIAPDENYLIFESQRPESIDGSIDLYISFKQKGGSWGHPKNMGPKINSKFSERFARLSPDGKYLFFGSNRRQQTDNLYYDIFWIDASVIDELRRRK